LFEGFLRKVNKLGAQQQLEAQSQRDAERSCERGPGLASHFSAIVPGHRERGAHLPVGRRSPSSPTLAMNELEKRVGREGT
jgi:hypothetical protein